MLPETKMQKYLYKAHAVALRGSIRKPYFQEVGDHLNIATYAGSQCRIKSSNHGFALGEDIQYDSARTEIVAFEHDGVYETTLMAQVKGLKIGKRLSVDEVTYRLSVDEVTCRLRSVYNSSAYPGRCLPRILPAGSTIQNLQIDGKEQELHLPPAFEADETTCEEFFLGKRDEGPVLEPGPIPEPIYVKGFGTIYYAEWTWVHPQERRQQSLTMLRLALGSDFGAGLDVSHGGSDGTGWPPTAL